MVDVTMTESQALEMKNLLEGRIERMEHRLSFLGNLYDHNEKEWAEMSDKSERVILLRGVLNNVVRGLDEWRHGR
jgi:hypothetical protein